jgi:hypothetical protein
MDIDTEQQGTVKEVETQQLFEYDTEREVWSNTGKYQNTVIYQVFNEESIVNRKLNSACITEEGNLPCARTAKQAFDDQADCKALTVLSPIARRGSMRERRGSMRMRKDSMQFDTAAAIPSRKQIEEERPAGLSEEEETKETEETVCAAEQRKPSVAIVKTALERGKAISIQSAKFHYCWTASETGFDKPDRRASSSGLGYGRDRKARGKKKNRRASESTLPDARMLSEAYTEFGYEVEVRRSSE